MQFSPTAVVGTLTVTTLVACGGAMTGAPSMDAARDVTAHGTFAAPPATPATYDNALVPAGATAHTKPCGSDGKDAGPHFQFKPDPVMPSVDPAYANNMNEIWLDLTTDAAGSGRATSTVPWTFAADRRAASVIIHAMPTSTKAGTAGSAGDRAACITVGF